MSKLTLSDVQSLTNEQSALSTINANSAATETALANTLSRDGSSPNEMLNNLDMNSYRILNLPGPATAAEPLRYQDLNSFLSGGTITNVPVGGATNAVLVKTSNTDYAIGWTNTLDITPTVGTLNKGINITQGLAGSTNTYTPVNRLLIASDAVSATTGGGGVVGFDIADLVTGTDQGFRSAVQIELRRTGAANASNVLYQDVGLGTVFNGQHNNNGTNLGAGAKGGGYGMYAAAGLSNNATNWFVLTGGEFDLGVETGSSAAVQIGVRIAHTGTHAIKGTTLDSALDFASSAGAVGWDALITADNVGGDYPLASTGTFIRTLGSQTFAHGIDFTSATITGSAFQSPGVSISGGGILSLTNSTANIRIGNPDASNTPYMDWHSSGSATNFDTRLIASGGSATDGAGVLQLQGTFNIVTAAASVSPGFRTQQSGPTTGSLGEDYSYNSISITSDNYALTGNSSAYGFLVDQSFGGSNVQGHRAPIYAHLTQTTDIPATGIGDHSAFVARIDINGQGGGTGTGAGTAKGGAFGQNIVVASESGTEVHNWASFVGTEYDFTLNAGTTCRAIVGITMAKLNNDVRGVAYDAAFSVACNGGTYWNNAFCVSDYNGNQGVSSTGTILGHVGLGNVAQPWGVANGVDFGDGVSTGFTFSGNAFKSKGFTVDGSGNTTALVYKVGSNQVVGARSTGWTAMTGTPDLATSYATSTVTTAQLAGRVMALQAALTTHGLIGT